MAAVFDHRRRGLQGLRHNGVNLGRAAILVVAALHDQRRAGDRRQQIFDIPELETVAEPGLGPRLEYRLRLVAVILRQRAQLARVKGRIGGADAVQRHVFHEHMRGLGHDGAQQWRLLGRMDQRDAAAVRMADHDIFLPGYQVFQHQRQFAQRVVVHVMQPALFRQWRRAAIAEAVVQQAAATGGLAQPGRKVLPHGAAAQTFMQEHQHRPGRVAWYQLVMDSVGGMEMQYRHGWTQAQR